MEAPKLATTTEMAAPLVSVLMPVFNTGDYLLSALRSIAEQSYPNVEFIAIDDGSQDSSLSILRQFASVEPRLTVVTRENRGLVATRNELLRLAQGELVAWMDSDDISHPERLALQVAALRNDPAVVCVGSFAQCVDPAGRPLNVERYPLLHDEIVEEQLVGGGLRFASTTMRRQAALGVGGFRGSFRIGEDLDLLMRLGETGRLSNLPNPLYVYRQHAKSVCATLGPQWIAHRNQILELARERRLLGSDRLQRGEAIDLAVAGQTTTDRAVAETYIFWARCALQHGDRPRALRYVKAAISTDVGVWKSCIKSTLAILSTSTTRTVGVGSDR